MISGYTVLLEKIHFVVTDYGSNMFKAFKQVRVMVEQQNVPNTEEEEGIEQEMEEFDREEADSSAIFKVQGINRLSCFAHTL